MKWLYEKNCPWDEETIWTAVDHGSLKNIKWLRANGCPWGIATILGCRDNFPELNFNANILTWMQENGCPMQ